MDEIRGADRLRTLEYIEELERRNASMEMALLALASGLDTLALCLPHHPIDANVDPIVGTARNLVLSLQPVARLPLARLTTTPARPLTLNPIKRIGL